MERLIYSSRRNDDTDSKGYSPQFAEIGEVAAARNLRLGITGFLICTPTWFSQILEGGHEALERVFALISRDKRHFQTRILSRERDIEASFPNWGMGWHHQTINNRILFLEQGLVQDEPPEESDAPAVGRLAHELAKGLAVARRFDEIIEKRWANLR